MQKVSTIHVHVYYIIKFFMYYFLVPRLVFLEECLHLERSMPSMVTLRTTWT